MYNIRILLFNSLLHQQWKDFKDFSPFKEKKQVTGQVCFRRINLRDYFASSEVVSMESGQTLCIVEWSDTLWGSRISE